MKDEGEFQSVADSWSSDCNEFAPAERRRKAQSRTLGEECINVAYPEEIGPEGSNPFRGRNSPAVRSLGCAADPRNPGLRDVAPLERKRTGDW